MEYQKHEKQEWRETRLKGKMAESLVYSLLQESGNEVYAIGYEEILPGLSGEGRSKFVRNTIIGKKITAIPDLFVIDQSRQPHLVEVKFRYNSKWHENDKSDLEFLKKNWEEAIIVVVNCHEKPYFRLCRKPFWDDQNQIISEPLLSFISFNITEDLLSKFDPLVKKYLAPTLNKKKHDLPA